jgi:hypothetical protein
MVIYQPSESRSSTVSSEIVEGGKLLGQYIFVYAAPGCGAELFIHALAELKNFSLAPGTNFPIKGVARIFRHMGRHPAPGLHFLTDYLDLLKAARRLLDSIVNATPTVAAAPCPKIVYSADNIFFIPILRQLYPEALHLHFVRNISVTPLRMAAEAELPVWRLCEQWHRAEQAFLDAPPWPAQVTITYEELERSPADTASSVMRLARLPFTTDDAVVFSQRFPHAPPEAHLKGRPAGALADGSHRTIADRIAGQCIAVCCQAELAALNYKPSMGRPGFLRTFAAAATLRLISHTARQPQHSDAGRSYR